MTPRVSVLSPPLGEPNRWLHPTDLEGVDEVHVGAEIIGYVWLDRLDNPPGIAYRALTPSLNQIGPVHGSRTEAAGAVREWHEAWGARYIIVVNSTPTEDADA
jgi:hypothetical protein